MEQIYHCPKHNKSLYFNNIQKLKFPLLSSKSVLGKQNHSSNHVYTKNLADRAIICPLQWFTLLKICFVRQQIIRRCQSSVWGMYFPTESLSSSCRHASVKINQLEIFNERGNRNCRNLCPGLVFFRFTVTPGA